MPGPRDVEHRLTEHPPPLTGQLVQRVVAILPYQDLLCDSFQVRFGRLRLGIQRKVVHILVETPSCETTHHVPLEQRERPLDVVDHDVSAGSQQMMRKLKRGQIDIERVVAIQIDAIELLPPLEHFEERPRISAYTVLSESDSQYSNS